MRPGGGVCGAIFAAAGYDKLEKECAKIGYCETGSAVITSGYKLCKYIIHTPVPVYSKDKNGEEKLLYSCYKSSLEFARDNNVESIAFPLISSGIYGYPKQAALRIATDAVMDFLENNDMDIFLVVYNKQAFEISSKLFGEVKEYIDEQLITEENCNYRRREEPYCFPRANAMYSVERTPYPAEGATNPAKRTPYPAEGAPCPAARALYSNKNRSVI